MQGKKNKINFHITGYFELKDTHKDLEIQLLNESPIRDLNPEPGHYQAIEPISGSLMASWNSKSFMLAKCNSWSGYSAQANLVMKKNPLESFVLATNPVWQWTPDMPLSFCSPKGFWFWEKLAQLILVFSWLVWTATLILASRLSYSLVTRQEKWSIIQMNSNPHENKKRSRAKKAGHLEKKEIKKKEKKIMKGYIYLFWPCHVQTESFSSGNNYFSVSSIYCEQ